MIKKETHKKTGQQFQESFCGSQAVLVVSVLAFSLKLIYVLPTCNVLCIYITYWYLINKIKSKELELIEKVS